MTSDDLLSVAPVSMFRGLGGLILCIWPASGCDAPPQASDRQEPIVRFDTAVAIIESQSDTIRLVVELAETPDQQAHGLMERESLPPDEGMLFLYPSPQDSSGGFWMFRTLIPLDVAFLDDDGRILSIMRMEPCESPYPQVCHVYSPNEPFSGALEVNRGYFGRTGVQVGDRVWLSRKQSVTVPAEAR